jgi:hypothetical protein
MKEIKLGKVQFTESLDSNETPWIIGLFGREGSGKTRLPITGPEVIGYIPLEKKSYKTISDVGKELGKRVIVPKNSEQFIINSRKANMLSVYEGTSEKAKGEANNKLKAYYREYADRIYDATYAMLEHGEIRTVVIDTFTQMCGILESANYGFEDKMIRIESQVYKDKRDYRQEVIDFLNSLPGYNKTVWLLHRERAEYAHGKDTGRKVHEGFQFLGNYTNLLLHAESNPKWNPNSEDEDKSWHWALSCRTVQANPTLEGPDGYRMLKDDEISFSNLIMAIDPNVDMDTLI